MYDHCDPPILLHGNLITVLPHFKIPGIEFLELDQIMSYKKSSWLVKESRYVTESLGIVMVLKKAVLKEELEVSPV